MKFRLLFVPDREAGMQDARLRMRITWSGHRLSFSVGHRVTLDKWSYDTQRCKANTYHGSDKIPSGIINADLQTFEDAVKSVMLTFSSQHIDPSVDELRKALAPLLGKEKQNKSDEQSLLTHFNLFILEQGAECSWAKGTYVKLRTIRTHLAEWKPNITYNDLTADGLSQFCEYLVTSAPIPRSTERGLRNSTAKRDMEIVKWFLRWAASKGYHTDSSYIYYRCRLKIVPPPVIFLSWEELMKVWNHQFKDTQPGLERVRDCFCFQCFTSLRYSDLRNLKYSDIDFDNDIITVTTIKTDDPLCIELNKYSRAILHKYVDPQRINALPVISNQKYNDALVDIGKLCGIDSSVTEVYYKGAKRYEEVHKKYDMLSSHAGRRTFICNSLVMGIPADVVMKWTGHSDYKSMRPYIAIADTEKKKAMKLFDEK